MHRAVSRFSRLAALGILAACDPAAAQNEVGVASSVAASSVDEEYDPYRIDEDYDEDSTLATNDAVHAEALTCGFHPCAVPPPFVGEAEANAVTDFGHCDVDVRSETWSDSESASYRDSADAGGTWEDELVFTWAQPIPSATIRARFRIEGSWQNRACFGFAAYFYDPATESQCTEYCCPCYDVYAHAGTQNQDDDCVVVSPFDGGHIFVLPFPDFDDEDGSVDTTVTVEFPLILDSPVRFGSSLSARTGRMNGSTLNFGVEATVEALEVPFGVTVDSATNSEGAYNVPEPEGVAGAIAVGALAALRRRAVLA
jgi:MYXO-CTERM domain-containing protein